MADPVYQDQPYMRKSFLFFSDVYLTGAVHFMDHAAFHVFRGDRPHRCRFVDLIPARSSNLSAPGHRVGDKAQCQA